MKPFSYVKPTNDGAALDSAKSAGAQFLAGGTSLLDLWKLGVEQPDVVVDVNGLAWSAVEEGAEGIRIGALARNSDVARHPLVRTRLPMLSHALLSGASPQLRNMATVGGNLLQRTRCPYFRDIASACNKRAPGAGCDAMNGYNRSHAVLGTSDRCIATHPSDMSVALVALDATIHTRGREGARAIPATDFHLVPGDHPELESRLDRGELITHVTVPTLPFAARSVYLKVRDRAQFAFALASAAVALDVQNGSIRAARVALGGVATKPWRSAEAEGALVGQAPTVETFRRAAHAAMQGAQPRRDNAFKVELAQRTLVRALSLVSPASPGSQAGAP